MGTHAYQVLMYRRNAPKRPTFKNLDDLPRRAYSFSDFCDEDDDVYYESATCREFVLDIVEPTLMDDVARDIAIRCLGEQYHKVSNIIRTKKDGSKILSEFFSRIFGFEAKVTRGAFTKKAKPNANIFTRGSILQVGTKTKKVNGYVDILCHFYPDSRRSGVNFLAYSTMLAVLKETIVTKAILNGEVTDYRTLAAKLFEVALERQRGNMAGYNCWMLYGSHDRSRIIEELQEIFNGDGSDYASIAALGCFVMAYGDLSMQLPVPELDEVNGPVTYVNDCIDVDMLERILNSVKAMGIDIGKIAYRYDDEAGILIDGIRSVFPLDSYSDDEYEEDDDGYEEEW